MRAVLIYDRQYTRIGVDAFFIFYRLFNNPSISILFDAIFIPISCYSLGSQLVSPLWHPLCQQNKMQYYSHCISLFVIKSEASLQVTRVYYAVDFPIIATVWLMVLMMCMKVFRFVHTVDCSSTTSCSASVMIVVNTVWHLVLQHHFK